MIRRSAPFACCAASIAAGAWAQSPAPFTSEHAARGVTYNMLLSVPISTPMDGFGMASADLDGDGDLDLVLLGRADGTVGIYENQGSGSFVNRSAASGIVASPTGCGVAAFDYDRDGDLDLYIAQRHHPCRLWRNDGNLQFVDVTSASGLALSAPAAGCSVVDYDGDGHLDLYVCVYSALVRNRLYRNLGDGTFVDVAPALGVDSTGLSYQSTWTDVNRDGRPDLCVSNDRGFGNVPNQLWLNTPAGFIDVGLTVGMDVALCSMGMACGDLNGDARPDFYFTNLPDPAPPLFGVNPLLLSTPSGAYVQSQAEWGVENRKFSWGAIFWDFDNDADLDLYVNNETFPNAMFVNGGSPPMTDRAAALAIAGSSSLSYVSVVGDLDGDGDQDLLLNNYAGPVRLLMNQEGQSRRWLRLRVAGEGRVRDAAGACAAVVADGPDGTPRPAQWREVLVGGNGYLGQNETTLHFGLGDAAGIRSIEVRWAHGGVRTLRGLAVDRAWTAYPDARLGDVDGDGAVDLADWAAFVLWGQGPLQPGREMLDFDGDGDIGPADVAAFWVRSALTRGDLDGDGSVNGIDLGIMLAAWGTAGSVADLDANGAVDGIDLGLLLSSWG